MKLVRYIKKIDKNYKSRNKITYNIQKQLRLFLFSYEYENILLIIPLTIDIVMIKNDRKI